MVCTWDVGTRRCKHMLQDHGNLGAGGSGAALALSPDSRLLATGSASGIVNLYRRAQVGRRQFRVCACVCVPVWVGVVGFGCNCVFLCVAVSVCEC